MKKIISCITAAALILTVFVSVDLTPVQAEESEEVLAELSYQAAEDVAASIVASSKGMDLDSSYGSKSEGYLFTGGSLAESAKLFASVSGDGLETIREDDPATPDVDESYSPLRKIEWSKAEYTVGQTENHVVPVMTAGNKNKWGKTPYFLIQFSTVGYESIHFRADLSATKKGPKNLKLQYSADGKVFADIESGSYSIQSNKVMATAFDTDLTGKQFAGQDKLFIRIIAADTAIVSGEGAFYDESTKEGTTSGELAINNIRITGKKTAVVQPTETPVPTEKATQSPGTNINPTANPTAKPTVSPTPESEKKTTKTAKKVFKLNKKSIKLKKGKSYKLKVVYSPKSYGKNLTWKSSKKKVAKVSKKGKVTALKKGTAIITVKNKAGKKAKCKVTVVR